MKSSSQRCSVALETSSSVGRRNLRLTPEQYAARLWDWTALNECFDRGIRVSDIDGFIEAHNHFLFIEGKGFGGIGKRGQRLALQRLAQIPKVTVIVLLGTPPSTVKGWEVIGARRYLGALEELKGWIRLWFEAAERDMELE